MDPPIHSAEYLGEATSGDNILLDHDSDGPHFHDHAIVHVPVREGYGFRSSGVTTPVKVHSSSPSIADMNGLGWPGKYSQISICPRY